MPRLWLRISLRVKYISTFKYCPTQQSEARQHPSGGQRRIPKQALEAGELPSLPSRLSLQGQYSFMVNTTAAAPLAPLSPGATLQLSKPLFFPYLIPASEQHCKGLGRNCYTCSTDKESAHLRHSSNLAQALCCLSSRSSPECKLSGSSSGSLSRKRGYLFLNIQLS